MNQPRKAIVLCLVRITLGALFLWAALTKLPSTSDFSEEIARYQLLPGALVPLFSVCVVCTEAVCGVLLIIGIAVRAAAFAVALMLVSFIVAMSQALARHLDLSCGCFGGRDPVSAWTIVRDLGMLAACVPLLRTQAPRVRVWPRFRPAMSRPTPGNGSD